MGAAPKWDPIGFDSQPHGPVRPSGGPLGGQRRGAQGPGQLLQKRDLQLGVLKKRTAEANMGISKHMNIFTYTLI